MLSIVKNQIAFLVLFLLLLNAAIAQDYPNTQKEAIPFTPPHEALEMMEVPEGFEVTLFAHEPDVHQPIAMTFDSRGRLWVVENYTYSDNNENFNNELHDRVVIFEDKDNDGKFDERKVFWDKGNKLTGIELGRGGVWLTAAPEFIFVPDRDRDDVPDGPPEVILDGFEDDTIRHNFVNGLRWGPDGWLYSRHGIQAVSHVGRPGDPKSKRTPMNCCVWRYHPEKDVFEIVAEGGTNFWGLDFDQHGEMFVINTVIGHLFHIVPGARYNRMHGSHFNPYTFQTIDQTADHFHFATDEKWWDAKNSLKDDGEVSGPTDKAGGGHAHSGFMIYQGDNWPDQFRGRAFTLNFHGRRMNQESLVRDGNSYVARHEPDMFRTADPWFRGVELTYGPDGSVYVLDWSDIGECHENDGIHRTSGRIFKISYGKPEKPPFEDLRDLSTKELVKLFEHKNEWYPRMAQRILIDKNIEKMKRENRTRFEIRELLDLAYRPKFNQPAKVRLRAIWTLKELVGIMESLKSERYAPSDMPEFCARLVHAENEHVRAWAVRLAAELPESADRFGPVFVKLADDPSALVRHYVASSLPCLKASDIFEVAKILVSHDSDMKDRVQPKLIWHRIEPHIVANADKSLELFAASKSQLLRRNIARRLACDPEKQIELREKLVRFLLDDCKERHDDVLHGIKIAIEGRRQVKPPPSWPELVKKADELMTPAADLIADLRPVFGDGQSIDRLMKLAVDGKVDSMARQQAISSLAQVGDPEVLFEHLKDAVKDRSVSPAVVKTLAVCQNEEVASAILNHFPWLPVAAQENAIDTLCSRKPWTKRLLGAVRKGRVPSEMLTAWHARQIQMHGDQQITKTLGEVWGQIRDTNQEKLAQIGKLRELMTAEAIAAAKVDSGKKLFQQHCANCHAMYGEGKAIGPDLTGADRKNLNYLLENIVDPGASVATTYRASVLAMEDGRLLTGVVLDNNGQMLKLQTQEELLALAVDSIDKIKKTELSLMPDGLLDKLSDQEKVDLFGYLMSK